MKILAIDDEPISQYFLKKTLEKFYTVTTAGSGEEGLRLAAEILPDIIILDVHMPGIDGYTVCRELKANHLTSSIPVIFLSASAESDEQVKGYQVGGDDYITKPCNPETLLAKVKVIFNYRDDNIQLKKKYKEAQKTANIAMTGSSEIGMAMQFVEQAYLVNDYSMLAELFFTLTDKLNLICAVMFFTHEGPRCFFSDGAASPLEVTLLKKMRNQNRIFDFGRRTFINYPNATFLVKNMPIDTPEKYGRIKDLLPAVLGNLSNKIFTMKAGHAILTQSEALAVSFSQITTSLLSLGVSLRSSQLESTEILKTMYDEMSMFLPRLGLEEDQEEYILNHIEQANNRALDLNDNNTEIETSFQHVTNKLQSLLDRQNQLLIEIRPAKPNEESLDRNNDYLDNVELF
ncbi:MAG: response regulator [Gammaproteobacteria bacterium]|nr:response regulator [Gammaproteobacteria bacterium]MDH5777835.1 response regulator [Gammaproteobacteria bacterium]